MYSKWTYAIWDFTIALLAVLFAYGNFTRGTYWLAWAEVFMVVVFVVYGIMALTGRGLYKKYGDPNHKQINR